ncbi:YybS family protein [Clostridium swellfunianum]|uniref:YybS family protein n=1 Tax=Clostridium swellfunianum TaxID=1367462 RepID=UPI0020304C87|nr:YybS family protein [Clostridium swellfunianum]MCM0649294.1 YybS family protein [Clostridium swellfunianum]
METRKYSTKSTVEAGIISAIIVVLMLITGYVPIMSFMGTLILPVPVALLFIRHDIKVTTAAIVVSTIITAVLFNPIQALLSAISFGLTGLTLGYSIKKDKSSNYTLFLLAVMSLIATILTYIATVFLIQKTTLTEFFTTFINEMNSALTESINMVKSFYSKAGVPEEQFKQIESMFSMFNAEFLINAFASILIFQSIFSAFLNYITAKAVLKRLGYHMKKMTPFTELYINSFAGALIVLPIPLGVYLKAKNLPLGGPILTSGQIIMQYSFLIVGASVAAYYLRNRFKLSNGIITLILLFVSFNPLFASALLYLGIADMIIDFRKVNPNRVLKR